MITSYTLVIILYTAHYILYYLIIVTLLQIAFSFHKLVFIHKYISLTTNYTILPSYNIIGSIWVVGETLTKVIGAILNVQASRNSNKSRVEITKVMPTQKFYSKLCHNKDITLLYCLYSATFRG